MISPNQIESTPLAQPVLNRQKLEPVRRQLTVQRVESLTPRMLRLTLAGEELAGFVSPSPDDHIKVFFSTPDGSEAKRDYTPRSFNVAARTLNIDFALHEGGVGSEWARQARPGDQVQIGGPRGSTSISAPGAWWLLIGDETAMPSIGRRIEEMGSGTRVLSLIAVTGSEEEQQFKTSSDHNPSWVYRPETQAQDPAPLLKALSELKLPSGLGFIWIGAQEEVSRALRSYLIDTLGHPPEWIKASAYW